MASDANSEETGVGDGFGAGFVDAGGGGRLLPGAVEFPFEAWLTLRWPGTIDEGDVDVGGEAADADAGVLGDEVAVVHSD